MADGREYELKPKGFWNSKIELKEGPDILLEFKMGWEGIVIKTYFGHSEKHYILKLKGLLSSKFILYDEDDQELMVAETDFKWKKFILEYNIETSDTFDRYDHKNLLLLTVLHCMNYYMTYLSTAA